MYPPDDSYNPYLTEEDIAQALSNAREDLKRQIATELASKLAVDYVTRPGHVREQIIEVAQEVGADLIVLGTHGRRGLSRLLLGSIAEGVVRLAPVSVLIVR